MNNDTLTLAAAKTGALYASFAGLHLNSPYDPVREAARFLDRRQPSPSTSTFLILGDTLPYLRQALHERFPDAEVISIYFHRDFPSALGELAEGLDQRDLWSPAKTESLRSFLRHRLAPTELEDLAVLQWPPALRAFPELAETAARTIEQIVREGTADWVTSTAFARSWIHNLFANFLAIDQWHLLAPHHMPVLVAASGPSLSRALPAIRRDRTRLALIALPSSLEALAAAGITPDLLVNVDAGYWAQLHLRALDGFQSTPVALPLIAARGIWRSRSLPVVLSAGSFPERELFQRARLAPFEVRATATVGATALELASRWTDGPLLMAGLDLCYDGLEEHVRPHPFDTYFQATATRTRPHLAVVADRLLKLGLSRSQGSPAVTPALRTYARWFREWEAADRVFRLFPSRVAIEGFTTLDDPTELFARSRANSLPASVPVPTPDLSDRRQVVSRLLDAWHAALSASAGREPTTRPGGETAEDLRVFELLDNLVPQGARRFHQRARAGRERSPISWAELVDEAQARVAELKRRFLA